MVVSHSRTKMRVYMDGARVGSRDLPGALISSLSSHHLYYYSSPVVTNLSSKFDENLPALSEFNSDHLVNFSTPRSCQSATFMRPFFAFVLCFLRQKIIKKPTNAVKAYRSA